MSTLLLVEQAAPDTPSANQVIMYPQSDGLMYTKDDTGAERLVSTGTTATFTATGTGFTANPTATAAYSLTNNVVTLHIPSLSGTSNLTTFTVTGLPAAIRPATAHQQFQFAFVDNGGAATGTGRADIETNGTITLYTSAAAGGWTGSGTKTKADSTFTYNLD